MARMGQDDAQFMALLKGKRIKLTLRTSSYFGVVLRVNPNKTLVLADVCGIDGRKFQGTKLFFGREILNVEFASEEDDARKPTDDISEEQLGVERFLPYRKLMTLEDDDDDGEECVNFIVIDEIHEKFGPAVMHIRKQHVIGVGGEGVEIFKNGRLCWLQISTKNKVYLFDILLLGAMAFKNGLSMILESKQILKVIHDCRAIAASLIAQFVVKLTNVFDTQVADVMCFYTKTGGFLPDRVSTLPEVVSVHLNVPSSRLLSLRVKTKLTKEEMEMWYKRPCPVPLLKVMALSVTHLKPLRLVLLDTLMTDYMGLVDSYLTSSLYEPDGLDYVTMDNLLELPKELRKLEEIRSTRQKWACNHYPVTEQGLLARFDPYPEPAQSSTQSDSLEAGPPTSHPSRNINTPDSQEGLPRLSSFVCVSPDVSSNPQTEMSNTPHTASLNKEFDQVRVDVMEERMHLSKQESSFSFLPSSGRGFLLQKPLPPIPGGGAPGVKSPVRQAMMAPGAAGGKRSKPRCGDNELPKNSCDTGEDLTPVNQSISSLIQ